jgi:hypothetical protein
MNEGEDETPTPTTDSTKKASMDDDKGCDDENKLSGKK